MDKQVIKGLINKMDKAQDSVCNVHNDFVDISGVTYPMDSLKRADVGGLMDNYDFIITDEQTKASFLFNADNVDSCVYDDSESDYPLLDIILK